ncbi:hypothetical protein COCNU_07G003960 [Cocos nucifera]|uniref:C3H1-type domain-containing protein n=1 Tax=Cocos nucifera TaxID=13894 RepID=A0A8K0IF22_COCNU|nr:hypothetical protein COCNU_07G003960 [Cocos nucifera]
MIAWSLERKTKFPHWVLSLLVWRLRRSYRGRRCKKFYTDEGCLYGDHCIFIHDEQLKAQEGTAVSLSQVVGGGGYGGGANGSNWKPSN